MKLQNLCLQRCNDLFFFLFFDNLCCVLLVLDSKKFVRTGCCCDLEVPALHLEEIRNKQCFKDRIEQWISDFFSHGLTWFNYDSIIGSVPKS